ncbi:methyltransferase [Pseudomonas sp. LRF_L74]|uniref:methyltransferase n=1 Tax=Pseudomonas sp. LRF_L74 TaxID=3369422 RepID=UPI003F63A0CE
MLSGNHLLERFQALDVFLLEHQHLWRPKPFVALRLEWETQLPALSTWLRRRSLEQAEADHNRPHLIEAPAPFSALARTALALSEVDALPAIPSAAPSSRQNVDVPGRKWQQIEAFGACLQFRQAPAHWLDWCSGKGHLGRLLASGGAAALTCLEHDPALVAAGQRQSDRLHIAAQHRLQDVMAAGSELHVRADHTPVALHACGDLHVRLLKLASAAGCGQLAVAPCCYNRIAGEQYIPLSMPAAASALELSLDDLRLPLSETVTAGSRQRRQRDQSMARRLSFDLLQRQLRGSDGYLPTPSLPVAWLHESFEHYCRHLASLKTLEITGQIDWDDLERQGWQRLAEVRNLELLRNLFRRPLELWLVLDRALYLREQGYHVRLGSFCPYELTPRNLMLLAERP